MAIFRDRSDAGCRLAEPLVAFCETDAHVLGMARGGVMVAAAVADVLGLPLQALVVRKLGAPRNPELAIGAVGETGQLWVDRPLMLATGATEDYLEAEISQQVAEARRRKREYAAGAEIAPLDGATCIVVDDGIATGASALVGVRSCRDLGAGRVILATPVASPQAAGMLRGEADDLVVLATPNPFVAVGLYYDNFEQTTDEEVVRALQQANAGTKVKPWIS